MDEPNFCNNCGEEGEVEVQDNDGSIISLCVACWKEIEDEEEWDDKW